MTELLEKAIAQLKTLPPDKQDAIAARLLAEVSDYERDRAKSPSQEIARSTFERHFGTLSLEDTTSLDNERIDADLAREYLNLDEDE